MYPEDQNAGMITAEQNELFRRILNNIITADNNTKEAILNVFAALPGAEVLRTAGYTAISPLSWENAVTLADFVSVANNQAVKWAADVLATYARPSTFIRLTVPTDSNREPFQTWYEEAGFSDWSDFSVWLTSRIPGHLVEYDDWSFTFIVDASRLNYVITLADTIGLVHTEMECIDG